LANSVLRSFFRSGLTKATAWSAIFTRIPCRRPCSICSQTRTSESEVAGYTALTKISLMPKLVASIEELDKFCRFGDCSGSAATQLQMQQSGVYRDQTISLSTYHTGVRGINRSRTEYTDILYPYTKLTYLMYMYFCLWVGVRVRANPKSSLSSNLILIGYWFISRCIFWYSGRGYSLACHTGSNFNVWLLQSAAVCDICLWHYNRFIKIRFCLANMHFSIDKMCRRRWVCREQRRLSLSGHLQKHSWKFHVHLPIRIHWKWVHLFR